jgi:N-acetylneuraminic acid mutarotase
MAQTALPAPRTQPTPRRRAFFGLFDADGWGWATVKAAFWFIVLILMLGYIPDRAYYFTVQKTVDLGLLAWSPINFCPPENETLPCPAPVGATLPWHNAPEQIRLPAGRTDGVGAVIGQTYLYAGGSDGTAAVDTVYISHAVGTGNLDKWSEGPQLPEARSDAASTVVGNTLYLIGGYGPDGQPTSTVYSLTIANDGTLGDWKAEDALSLPSPRAGSAAVAVSDGMVVMGGTDGTAATRSVWKAQQDTSGAWTSTPDASGTPQAWVDQSPLVEENLDGLAVHDGDVITLIGGQNAQGDVVATVQQGLVGGAQATIEDPNAIKALWRASAQTNLPAPRTNLAGFIANGAIYIQGGSDGSSPQVETWWAEPDADGAIPEWHHLAATDLGAGLEGAAGVTAGSHAFLFGGTTAAGLTNDLARANLAPQPPFFQVGILGATVPALSLGGEIGQQIGYLNAAGVASVNFALLVLIGWGFAHKERVRELVATARRRRG